MADSEWRPVPSSGFRPERDAADDDDFFEPLEDLTEAPPLREGLPPTYRMRHDAHYVDHLVRAADPLVRMIAVSQIDQPRPVNPRDVAVLTTSVAQFGLLQPLLVRRHNGRYELIAGAGRLAAASAAGLTEVPCVVHEADDWRARALAEAANVRPGHDDRRLLRSAARPATIPVAGLTELTDHLEAIGSCLHLFARRDRPLRERLARDLVEAEVQRAVRLAQGLAVLVEDPPLACGAFDVGRHLARLIDGMQPEQVLAKVHVGLEVRHAPVVASADERLVALAVTGGLAAIQAIVEPVSGATVQVTASADRVHRAAVVEIAQNAVALPVSRLARFFDAAWVERPGGARAAVGAAAARRIAELHAGSAAVSAADDGGCTLRLEFPSQQ